MPPIRSARDGVDRTAVEEYWTGHTVNSVPFRSAGESARYLEWRFDAYPLFRELMQLWGDHDGERLLDYGCGPGNDLVGFLLYTHARKVVGVDVSRTALALSQHRIGLHRFDLDRVELVHVADSETALPFEDASFDFVNCGGVLHHVSSPEATLAELARVLRPGGRANVMVYNRNSFWFHLYTAYERMIVGGAFEGLSVEEAFRRSTDGEECPVSRAYTAEEFLEICGSAGLEGEFVGGYFSDRELELDAQRREEALADERLGDEHRDFLARLTRDGAGFPLFRGKHAGVGGVYRLVRP